MPGEKRIRADAPMFSLSKKIFDPKPARIMPGEKMLSPGEKIWTTIAVIFSPGEVISAAGEKILRLTEKMPGAGEKMFGAQPGGIVTETESLSHENERLMAGPGSITPKPEGLICVGTDIGPELKCID